MDITVPEHVGKHFIASGHGDCLMAVCFDCCESDEEVESCCDETLPHFLSQRKARIEGH